MATLYEMMQRSVPPWRSLEAAGNVQFPTLPQREIDICLSCEYCASDCDRCDGRGNLTVAASGRGRPKKEIDTATLRSMLRLRRCNREMCAALGVSERTLQREKRKILEGDFT